jgi:hypothetical protein
MVVARRNIACAVLIGLASVIANAASMPPDVRPSKEGVDYFEKKIRPVLVHNCYECHSGDPAKTKGHLNLDTRDGLRKGGDSGAVIVLGHADSSLLIEALRYEGLQMPPKGQLPDQVVEDFKQWIEMGAPDPRIGKAANPGSKTDMSEARKFWAFQRPKAVPAPKVTDAAWPISDIDRFIRSRQEQEHLRPVADADRITLIRRATFDLTGLPPTPAEIDAFENDQSSGAFSTVVDRLLASARFGEQWGRHWFDVVHYAESTGKERNIPYRYAWRYRDYVIDSLNADKPFDRFIVEQLAGDLLPSRNDAERNAQVIATGFLALGPKGVNALNAEQFKMDVIDDQIDVTSRALLGLTVACARCHDHKFDPIPTTDYYALAGIFHSTETLAGVDAGIKSALDSRLLKLAGKDDRFRISDDQAAQLKTRREEISHCEVQIADLRSQLRQASRGVANQKSGKSIARSTISPTRPVDPQQVRDEIKKLRDRIDELEALPTPPDNLAMGVEEAASPSNCRVLARGELKDPGPEVPRGLLTVLTTPQTAHIDPRHSGRLELAHWIANKDNPLTARVAVNRVWEHLFGQGLVESVDNFGALGDEPSHPELLDALATQFMNQQWSLKRLIRTIMLSRVYQLSSQHNAEDYAIDPANKYLWRMQPRRLDAEEIRDAILAVSGQLDVNRPWASPVLEMSNGPVTLVKGTQEVRKPSSARSAYLPIIRGMLPDVMQVFDAADPNLIVGKRDVTTVPTQALFLMNNPFVLQLSRSTAARVLSQADQNQPARINAAFRLVLGRPPNDHERVKAASYLNDYRTTVASAGQLPNPQMAAWSSFCQALFQTGEFRYAY